MCCFSIILLNFAGEMIKMLVISTVLLAVGMGLLLIKVLGRKDGTFSSQHIHDSIAMRERGIHCVLDQDREMRNKENNKIKKIKQNSKMMKKYVFGALAFAAMLASCNNASPKMDEKPQSADAGSGSGMKIAYVEVDSLMTQYNFAKDYSVTLQKKSNNARNTLTQKGNQLQAAVNNFQQKLQSNGFQSREQAQSVQNAIERQQRDLQELQARLENELASETQKFNEALRDSLNNFLAAYNKDKKYDLILSKAGDNILFADRKYDITQDIVNGLNKRYKPVDAKKDEKKEDKK